MSEENENTSPNESEKRQNLRNRPNRRARVNPNVRRPLTAYFRFCQDKRSELDKEGERPM